MKILITTLNAKFVQTSLALRYLESYCRGDFPELKIAEYTINDLATHIVGDIYSQGNSIVAFSCYIWNYEETLKIAETLKKVSPETLIIFGGPEVSYDSKSIMEKHPFIDVVVFGEGEVTFKELLTVIKGTKQYFDLEKFAGIKGLSYRVNDKVNVGEPRPLLKELDQIPSPYEGDLSFLQNRIAYIESSRGCPFHCQYCLSATIEGVRYFSLERTKAELKKFIEAGVSQVKFVDRTFNCNPKRALEIYRFLYEETKQVNHDINFHFEIAADLMTEETIEFLKEIPQGLFQFEIGVQSTNRKTIESIQRKMDFAEVSQKVRQIRAANNIHLHLDLIAGLPDENWNSFKKSFNDVYSLKPHKLQLGFLKLLKGSGLRHKEKEYGYIYLDKPPYEVLASKEISYSELLELKDIEELVDRYLNSYRFNYSLEFILEKYFKDRPFDFYHEFAQFWREKGYYGMAHNQFSHYEFLGDFFQELDPKNFPLFKEILKLDWLLQGRSRSFPDYFREEEIASLKEEKKELKRKFYEFLKDPELVEKHLPDLKGLYAKQLGKILRVEEFDYNLWELLEGKPGKDLAKEKTAIVFNYKGRDKVFQRARVFPLPE